MKVDQEACGEFEVDGVGEVDTSVFGGRQHGSAEDGKETHGFGHRKGMKGRRDGEI